jgi:phage terminase Nu1 subunit (DNA packaging protein)
MTTIEPTDPTGRVTQAELARRLGVSRPSVCKAVKAGRIKPDESGKFDPVEAELQWLANTRPKAESVASKGQAKSSGYAEARTRKESALARLTELRLEQATGVLAPRSEFDFVLVDLAETLRNLLEGMPDRLAPTLAHLRDTADIRAEIAAACDDVMFQLSDHMQRRVDELLPAA